MYVIAKNCCPLISPVFQNLSISHDAKFIDVVKYVVHFMLSDIKHNTMHSSKDKCWIVINTPVVLDKQLYDEPVKMDYHIFKAKIYTALINLDYVTLSDQLTFYNDDYCCLLNINPKNKEIHWYCNTRMNVIKLK